MLINVCHRLLFSQSLFSLDLIEYFLKKVDQATEENKLDESLGNHAGSWQKGLDYFRLDGSSSSESRSQWCKSFNREDNPRYSVVMDAFLSILGSECLNTPDAAELDTHDCIDSVFYLIL